MLNESNIETIKQFQFKDREGPWIRLPQEEWSPTLHRLAEWLESLPVVEVEITSVTVGFRSFRLHCIRICKCCRTEL